jgi:hypothetical protein
MSAAVMPHGKATPILDPAKYDLDVMTLLLEPFAIAAPCRTVLGWWAARRNTVLLQGGDTPVGVIPLVGNQCGSNGERGQKTLGARVITPGTTCSCTHSLVMFRPDHQLFFL